jgi:hypothetical protein
VLFVVLCGAILFIVSVYVQPVKHRRDFDPKVLGRKMPSFDLVMDSFSKEMNRFIDEGGEMSEIQ